MVFRPYSVPGYNYVPSLPGYKLIYINNGRYCRMGGMSGRVLCVHDITIRIIIILITYICKGHNLATDH